MVILGYHELYVLVKNRLPYGSITSWPKLFPNDIFYLNQEYIYIWIYIYIYIRRVVRNCVIKFIICVYQSVQGRNVICPTLPCDENDYSHVRLISLFQWITNRVYNKKMSCSEFIVIWSRSAIHVELSTTGNTLEFTKMDTWHAYSHFNDKPGASKN